MSHDPASEINARWLDDRAAPPGSTVWVVWTPNGEGIDVKAICARHSDAEEWAGQQADPTIYCSSEWRVLGAGWPSEAPNQTKE